MNDAINEAFLARRGGVAWAKQFAETLHPERILRQIHEYERAHSQAKELLNGLVYFHTHRPGVWTGSAAEAASARVAEAIALTRALAEALHTTTTALSSVHENAGITQAGIASVPDQSHPVALRVCTDHLNSLDSSYSAAAAQLRTVHGYTASRRTHQSSAPAAAPVPDPGTILPERPATTALPPTNQAPDIFAPTYLASAGPVAFAPSGMLGSGGAPPNSSAPGAANQFVPGVTPPFATLEVGTDGLGAAGLGASGAGVFREPSGPAPRRPATPRSGGAGEGDESGVFGEDGFGNARMSAAGPSPARGVVFDDDENDEEYGARTRRWHGVLEDEEEDSGWIAPAVGGDESLLLMCDPEGVGRRRVVSVYDDRAERGSR